MDLLWSVTDDLYNSDHYPLTLTYNNPCPSIQSNTEIPQIWNYNKANWDLFQSKINFEFDLLDPTNNDTDIDEILNTMNSNIIQAARYSIPFKKIPTNKLPVPWWDDELKNVIKERRRCLRLLRRVPTIENKIAFQKARAIARKTMKTKRRSGWADFVSSIDHTTTSSEMFMKMNKLRGRYVPRHISALQKSNDPSDLTFDPKDISNLLASHFSSISSDDNYSPDFIVHKNTCEQTPFNFAFHDEAGYNSPIQFHELILALDSCTSKASGPDGISFILLKKLPNNALYKLLSIYNYIWLNGKFPVAWGEALILPLLKPGKNKLIPSNYRPISLINCSSKILEKIVNKRLSFYLEKHNLLNQFQSGGRRRRSTIDNLAFLEHIVATGFVKKEATWALFLDIQKAFDCTWRYKIIKNLFDLGINGYILRYLQNFLTNRRISVKCNGYTSSPFPLNNGIVQGSSLSPLLFIVFLNDMLSTIKLPIRSFLFIDDLLITIKGKNLDYMENILQSSLVDLENWAKLNGVTFSTDPLKSVCINFNRLRQSRNPTLHYAGERLKFYDKTKFLGLIWDSKLKWNHHVDYVKSRAMNALNMLKMVNNKQWGLCRESLLKFYSAYVLPIFDYGSMIYGSAKNNVLSKLNPSHHTGIRIVTGAIRSSPVPSLYVESGIPPLSIRRNKLLMNYVLKIAASPLNPIHKVIFNNDLTVVQFGKKPIPLSVRFKYNDSFLNSVLQNQIVPYNLCLPPWSQDLPNIDISLSKHKKTETSPVAYRVHFNETIQSKYPNHTPCFTDGSKSPQSTSCALSINGNVSSYSLNIRNSIFTAELLGIYLCLTKLNDEGTYTKVLLVSDSLSALSAMGNILFSNPIISLIYNEWISLKQKGVDITFLWCPSHCGIEGNEAVDAAANQVNHPTRVNLTTPDDLKPLVVSITKNDLKILWDGTDPNNKLKKIKRDTIRWDSSYRANRHEEVVLTRMRIGHTLITHSHLFKKEPPPICQCGERVTVIHILECPTLAPARSSLPTPFSLQDEEEGVDSLFLYLKRIDVYTKI
ncbi:hypothetical protein M8J77_005509 [Diaphorina citri]|nr:hypothetical protein M8J77_005509 [Diaphorina citri]